MKPPIVISRGNTPAQETRKTGNALQEDMKRRERLWTALGYGARPSRVVNGMLQHDTAKNGPRPHFLYKEKDMRKLATVLEDNNIAKIGVHMLFPEVEVNYKLRSEPADGRDPHENSRKIMALAEYAQYKASVLEFISYWKNDDDFFFIMEDWWNAPEVYSKAWKLAGLGPKANGNFFLSWDGGILPLKDSGESHQKEYVKANEEIGSMEKLEEFLKSRDGVFVFGIYRLECVLNALIDICHIYDKLGKKDTIYVNKVLSPKKSYFEKQL